MTARLMEVLLRRAKQISHLLRFFFFPVILSIQTGVMVWRAMDALVAVISECRTHFLTKAYITLHVHANHFHVEKEY